MKKKFLSVAFFATLLFVGTAFTACDDDNDNNDGNSHGNAVIEFENVTRMKDFVQSGTFSGQGENGTILPGQSIQFTFNAGEGQALMFATMYTNSNDLFFAPGNPGLQLFDSDGTALRGNQSEQIKLWDNGTRVNQVPGPDVNHPGTAQAENVTEVPGMDAQSNQYPPADQMMRIDLDYNPATSLFTIILTNTSNTTTHPTPFSPGVWAVSNVLGDGLANDKPFFTPGQRSTAPMTTLAEYGNITPLEELVTENTGIITTLSPAVVVVYSGTTNPLYTLNQMDAAIGLKELAQTGDGTRLKEALERLRYVDQVYIIGNGSIAPGEKFNGQFIARTNHNITFATKFDYSNDWFYSTNAIVESTVKGDITGRVSLLDSGTGVNQYPGAGNDQAIFGGTPQAESQNIVTVSTTTYPVPATSEVIKVELR